MLMIKDNIIHKTKQEQIHTVGYKNATTRYARRCQQVRYRNVRKMSTDRPSSGS